MQSDLDVPCQEKMSFDNESDAKTAATVADHQHGIKLQPYHCTKCDLWHNTTDYR